MYDSWRANRLLDPFVASQIRCANLSSLSDFTQGDLAFSLCRFITEVKRLDGNEYLPNTLCEIIVMIQMYLHENNVNWNLLDGEKFLVLRNVLDNTMKQRTADGLGVRRSSSVISLAQEQVMFDKGVLGKDCPLQILQTIIYMVGLHCALHGSIEHLKLCRPGFNCQINIEFDDHGKRRLVCNKAEIGVYPFSISTLLL